MRESTPLLAGAAVEGGGSGAPLSDLGKNGVRAVLAVAVPLPHLSHLTVPHQCVELTMR